MHSWLWSPTVVGTRTSTPFLTGKMGTNSFDGARHGGLCAEQGTFLAPGMGSVL